MIGQRNLIAAVVFLTGLGVIADACAPHDNTAASTAPSTTSTVSSPLPAGSTSTTPPTTMTSAATTAAPAPPATTAPPIGPAAPTGGGLQLVVVDGPGWTSAGLAGPSYAGEHCTYRNVSVSGADQTLPDPACTPGAIDSTVTQSNLDQTVCRSGGYTTSVRPPESVTEPEKYASMTAYAAPGPVSAYEFDHLVPLGLGGASDTRNLWPELNTGGTGGYILNTKDKVEADLHDAVCAGTTTLAAAQTAIAKDWTTADAATNAAALAGPAGRASDGTGAAALAGRATNGTGAAALAGPAGRASSATDALAAAVGPAPAHPFARA